jgi:hypothetical protein
MMVATPNGAEGWRDFPRPDFDDVTELVSLADGGVLALGREDSELGSFMSHRVLRYDRSTNRWHEVAPIPTARNEPQVAVLGDGRVVVAGGHVMETDVGDGEVTRSTEIFNPAGNAWSRGPDLIDARYGGVAMPLSDGGILVMGGQAALNTEGDTPFCPAPMTSVERLSSGS